jgi:AcrR family transcriptional regulator
MCPKWETPDKERQMQSSIRTFSGTEDLVRERREHIRECATALFVKKPYGGCNMSEILQACGMSKGGLYYYVGSKEDIRALIITHASEAHVEVHQDIRSRVADMSSTDAIGEAIRSLCKWMDIHQDEMIVMNHEVGNLSREERAPLLRSEAENVALFEEILTRGNEAGEFEVHDPKVLAHTIYLAVRAWADRRWYLRKLYSLDGYVTSLVRTTILAATGNAGRRSVN